MGSGFFIHRRRFTGQWAFIDGQAVTLHQAQVGGDAVAGFEQQDIAGDKLCSLDHDRLTIPDDIGGRFGQFLQGGDGFFGALFVNDFDGVQDKDHHKDGDAVADFSQDGVKDAGEDQQQDQRLGQFLQEFFPERFLFFFFKLVWPVYLQPARGFFGA